MIPTLPRRTLLATALAAPAIGSAFAQTLETKSVEIAGVRDPQLGAQLAVCDTFGLFKAEGLDVDLHWNQSAADTLTTMAGGIPVGVGGIFTQVVFAGQGLPIRTVSSLADIAETQGFVIGPDVNLASPKELEGKKLAFTQGNSQVLLLAKLAQMYKFDTAKVGMVNMQQSEGIVAASKGDVAGLLGWQPNLYRLVQMGGRMYANGTTLFVTGAEQKLPFEDRLQYNHSTLLMNDEWVASKPNTAAAVLRAMLKATQMILTDRPKAMEAMQAKLRIDPDALDVMATANKYGMGIGDSLARSLAFQSDWALQIKRIAAPVDPKQAFNPRPLNGIDPALVSWKA